MEETAASRPQKSRKGRGGTERSLGEKWDGSPVRMTLASRSGRGGLCRKQWSNWL